MSCVGLLFWSGAISNAGILANRAQSSTTIPEETWQYLIERGPYRDAKHLHRTLKGAKHLKRKCYDSLPFLCSHLCQTKVPRLSPSEMTRAMELFDWIDRQLSGKTMISYLFCLEYILKKLGRADVCEFINCIQCPKRRATYKMRLDKIFDGAIEETIEAILRRNAVHPPKPLQLQVPRDPALTPDPFPSLQEALFRGCTRQPRCCRRPSLPADWVR